ncbi:uncharacterized protein BDV17DRAFT_157850 [Aspergillus undulatus]|uniref:uncharacterized protein n=1 Tax=Aspergillus undulatus TaxID=1810928 RepID=UPI003CCE4EA9
MNRLGEQAEQHSRTSPTYVTRREWEELRRQVAQNTSRINSLSTTAQSTLGTTASLLKELGVRTGNEHLDFTRRILYYSQRYTEHLTALAKGLRGRPRGRGASPAASDKGCGSAPFTGSPQRKENSKAKNLLSKDRPGKDIATESHNPSCSQRPKIGVLPTPTTQSPDRSPTTKAYALQKGNGSSDSKRSIKLQAPPETSSLGYDPSISTQPDAKPALPPRPTSPQRISRSPHPAASPALSSGTTLILGTRPSLPHTPNSTSLGAPATARPAPAIAKKPQHLMRQSLDRPVYCPILNQKSGSSHSSGLS